MGKVVKSNKEVYSDVNFKYVVVLLKLISCFFQQKLKSIYEKV